MRRRKCTRCNNKTETAPVVNVRPGGHTMFLLSSSDFNAAIPPQVENVCGACLTDDEILHDMRLGGAVDYALELLQKRDCSPEAAKALSLVRAFFQIRNDAPDGSNRGVALRTLGFGQQRQFGHQR